MNFAGGSDESADSDLIPLLALESSRPHKLRAPKSSPPESSRSDSDMLQSESPEASNGRLKWVDAPRTIAEEDSDLNAAVLLSKTSLNQSRVARSDDRDVPEYSNIRHRLGIQRLLQVLEGRDPDLDSAPKVWTLWVLAKYFDCTPSVVSYLVFVQ